MTVAAIIAELEGIYYDVDFGAVKRWKEMHAGAKAIGHLPIYVPRELIHAAGMLPVGLMGAGAQLEIIRGDAYFQSYICQLPRSTIELALTGRLACLDGVIFPSICDVIRNLSGMWKLLSPDLFVHYLDFPQSPTPAGEAFYRRDLTRLCDGLAEVAGARVADAAIARSIAAYNENRAAIEALCALRVKEPWTVPTAELYLVLRAANVLPVDEHTTLVTRYRAAAVAEGRKPRDHTRVVVAGAFCEQPPLELIKTLEAAGCYIVSDDWVQGPRFIRGPIESAGDAIGALARAFLRQSVHTPTRYEPNVDRGNALAEQVHELRAEGVIFCAPSFCDPALLEQPMLERAIERAGIPSMAVKYAENLGQFQVIREQAGTFADSIRLWS